MLIIPLVLFLIILEFFKGSSENPDVSDIIRRAVISMILLISFSPILNTIGMLGDGIIGKLDHIAKIGDVTKLMGPNYENSSGEWFNLRDNIIYALAIFAYVIAYIGFFMAEVLTHFVWTILYIVSPLMILAYIPKTTADATSSLYKGLIKVVIWKILWTILGALLLKAAMAHQYTGLEDYLMSIVMNVCIGVAMLFIPFATRSLINDGLESAASGMAGLVAAATAQGMKAMVAKGVSATTKNAAAGLGFASKPVTNPFTGRAQLLGRKIKPKIDAMKKGYSQMNLPKELKDQPKVKTGSSNTDKNGRTTNNK